MTTWHGTLERVDFGPGSWTLRTDGGERLALIGKVPKDLAGKRVAVEGKSVEAMGFAMVGTGSIEVTRVVAAG